MVVFEASCGSHAGRIVGVIVQRPVQEGNLAAVFQNINALQQILAVPQVVPAGIILFPAQLRRNRPAAHGIINIIEEAYVLEVSSPGIERQIKYDWHFDENIGKKVTVKLYKKINESKVLVGELVSGSQKGDVTILLNGNETVIENENIIDVRIYFEFGGN